MTLQPLQSDVQELETVLGNVLPRLGFDDVGNEVDKFLNLILESRPLFQKLPCDIQISIFTFLNPSDLQKIFSLNSYFQSLALRVFMAQSSFEDGIRPPSNRKQLETDFTKET